MQLYDDDTVLAEAAAGFFAAGLRAQEPAVVIATRRHRELVTTALTALGIDVPTAVRRDRLVFLDVERVVREIVRPDGIDVDAFAAMLGPAFERGAREQRTVRAGGDLVATLWERGDVASAMRLEALGNELGAAHDSYLLCAYPRRLFADEGAAEAFERLAALHTGVLPCGDRSLADSAGAAPIAETLPRLRRRTLGPCAHCGEPVAHDEAYVRLYRRAWHLDCALEAEGMPEDARA